MARATPEWIATHDDQAIPRAVKARVFDRCGGKCARTGVKLGPGNPPEYDHIIPLIQGGAHRESNLQIVCGEAHKAKSAAEAPITAKVKRQHAKHFGIWAPSIRKIPSRPFPSYRRHTDAL